MSSSLFTPSRLASIVRGRRWTLAALLVLPLSLAVARAVVRPLPRASWTEDERIVLFSPDSRALLTIGKKGTRLLDARTGRVRAVLSPSSSEALHEPRFSPDGRLLFAEVSSDRFKPVIVRDLMAWDVATGRLRDAFAHVNEHMAPERFAISPDSRLLAFQDNSDRRPMQVRKSQVALDGQTFEIASNDSPGLPRVKIWDLVRWREIATVDGAPPLAFSSDGERLVTGDRDWHTPVGKLWDTSTGRLLTEFPDRSPGLWPLAFSPEGTFLAATAYEEDSLWEVASGRRWPLPAVGGGSQAPVFSRDSRLVFPNGRPRGHYSHDMNVDYPCYDVSSMPPRQLDLGTAPFIVSPDARRYVRMLGRTQFEPNCTLAMGELPGLRESARLDLTDLIHADFSPDGRWLLLSTAQNPAMPQRTGFFLWLEQRFPFLFPPDPWWQPLHELRLLDPATARPRASIRLPHPIWQIPHWRFSPDGETLAVWYKKGTGSDPGISDRPSTIELWDVPPAKPIGRMLGVPLLLTFLALLLGRKADARRHASSGTSGAAIA